LSLPKEFENFLAIFSPFRLFKAAAWKKTWNGIVDNQINFSFTKFTLRAIASVASIGKSFYATTA